MNDYQQFLESKKIVVGDVGFDVSDVHPRLFPFQSQLVQWAIRKGRAAIFADTGLGKSAMQIEWARHIPGRVLILAPLAVAHQTIREGQLMDVTITYAKDQSEASESGITITNYERLKNFGPSYFNGVVLDECFAAGTLVDICDVQGKITPTPIEWVREGDLIANAAGIDKVSDVHRREVKYAVGVTLRGKRIITSPNHPWFTQRGWVGSQNLKPGDRIIRTSTAMRMVSGTYPAKAEEKILQSILLSEMAYASTSISGKRTQSRSGGKEGKECIEVVAVGQSESTGANRAYSPVKSDGKSSVERENVPHIESDEPQTFRAWGQWQGIDDSTIRDAQGARVELAGGVCFITGKTNTRLSHLLQTGLGESDPENMYRSGWTYPSFQSGAGCEENGNAQFDGVESVEILELGHPELDQYRDADGKLYFYDIGATQHPSFSINGNLVHNSSILKSFEGKTRTALIEAFQGTNYRLCCTATPAPNDIAEIANHSEFLGVMSRVEMLATFFIHDDAGWRLKKHGRDAFYRWMASWGMFIKKPSDLGFSDEGYQLPPLSIIPTIVSTDWKPEGQLFASGLKGITDRTQVRKSTMDERAKAALSLINSEPDQQWLIWVGLNDEGAKMKEYLPDAIIVEGSQSPEYKADVLGRFASGEIQHVITKSSIAGYGMNFQSCARMIFVGMGDSYEDYYQSIRRCYRFGQTREVNAHIVLSEPEQAIFDNVLRKEKDALEMSANLVKHVAEFEKAELAGKHHKDRAYRTDEVSGEGWVMKLGDSCERLKEVESQSVGMAVFSPPFATLYTYSNSERDLGNARNYGEFFQQHSYITKELLRVMMPGRLVCVHVQQLPLTQVTDGVIGMRDFRGDMIKHYVEMGFVYHGEVCIDKNPQAQAIRTHTKGLMFVQLHKDSAAMRMAFADYILLFRAPGDNTVPVKTDLTNEEWIEYAHPVWYNINESDTLNTAVAKANEDERHICPLQLETIERCVRLWSNKGETVLSPFGGIGSEIYTAVRLGRKGIGIELKPEYWKVACNNIRKAETKNDDMFSYAVEQGIEL